MIRLIVILALGYGIYWCYNNVDFGAIINNAGQKVQSEKTINAVTRGRQQNADAVNEALGK